MSGKRLLDAAAILRASRAVASKHVALRRSQLNNYNETSSLVKAVRSQTDRVTLTVQAASALPGRFNEAKPEYSTQTQDAGVRRQSQSKTIQDGVGKAKDDTSEKQGLEQDHFYQRSEENTAADPPPGSNLSVKQEKATRYPLPDGSIPTSPNVGEVGTHDEVHYSDRPLAEATKVPLTGDRHEMGDGLQPTASGRTSIPDPADLSGPHTADRKMKSQREAEKQIPSVAAEPPPAKSSDLEVDQEQDVFYSASTSSKKVLSALPRVKIPKNTEEAQGSDEHISDAEINQDVYYSSSPKNQDQVVSRKQAIPEQENLTKDMYSGLFQSPRVAKMLGGQPKKDGPSSNLDLAGATDSSLNRSKPSEEKEQASSSMRTGVSEDVESSSRPVGGVAASKINGDEDVGQLAAEMTKDAKDVPADISQVGRTSSKPQTVLLID